eukprot:SAG31_NODE_49732_length_131_cov_8.031250_1_plen_34_part_10
MENKTHFDYIGNNHACLPLPNIHKVIFIYIIGRF